MIDSALNVIYPPRCILCDDVLKVGQRGMCSECRERLRFIEEPVCMRCGRPIDNEKEYCPDCEGVKKPYKQGRSVLLYDSRMKESISNFKYHGRQEYASEYARIINDRLGDWINHIRPDCFIPVPIHKSRELERGYNQALLISEELSKITGIPTLKDYLLRSKKTGRQKELGRQERIKNMMSAFSVDWEMEAPENVIIIDDIFTTGSTVEACANVLQEAGVYNIYFICLCGRRV